MMQAHFVPNTTRTTVTRSELLGSGVKRLAPEEVLSAYRLLEHVEHLYPGFRTWFAAKDIHGC